MAIVIRLSLRVIALQSFELYIKSKRLPHHRAPRNDISTPVSVSNLKRVEKTTTGTQDCGMIRAVIEGNVINKYSNNP